MLDGATAVGVSKVVKIPFGCIDHTVEAWFESLAATAISAVTIKLQGGMKDVKTEVIDNPVLATGTTVERVANGAFNYVIDDVSYSKGAVAAGSVFTAAHVITATLYGCINVYINAAGTIITKVPLATQAYTTAALAHAAADLIPLNRKLAYVGRLLIQADAGDWTANTDDITSGSDQTSVTFLSETSSFYDLTTHAFIAGEITATRAMFHQTDKTVRYVRAYLSTLTGTGEVNVRYIPSMRH
jgi:hypothetical protein